MRNRLNLPNPARERLPPIRLNRLPLRMKTDVQLPSLRQPDIMYSGTIKMKSPNLIKPPRKDCVMQSFLFVGEYVFAAYNRYTEKFMKIFSELPLFWKICSVNY
jgi:hypothetical protein